MSLKSILIPVIALPLCLMVCSNSSWAGWPANGAPVCVQPQHQLGAQLVSDGAGGMIVAWADAREDGANYYVYVQRLDGSGVPVWSPADGFSIDGGGHSNTQVIDVVSDGAHGAIVAWTVDGIDLLLQRVNHDGTTRWGDGSAIDIAAQLGGASAVLVSDGAGGVIVALPELVSGSVRTVAQKINADGTIAWPAGNIDIFSAASLPGEQVIVADGSGGALVAATFDAGEPFTYVMVQRIFASGSVWGSSVTTGLFSDSPAIATDGNGGAYFATKSSNRIVVQLVDGGGTIQWPSAVQVSAASPDVFAPSIIEDGSGNAVVCWSEERYSPEDCFVQKIDVFGSALWTAEGALVSLVPDLTTKTRLIRGSGTGLIVATKIDSVRAQNINVSGQSVWRPGGVAALVGSATDFDVASDGAGGFLSALSDMRGATGQDIYAQSVNSLGVVYAAEPTIASIADIPGDQGGWVQVAVSPSDRDGMAISEQPAVSYDVWRQVPPAAAAGDPTLAPDSAASTVQSPRGISRFEVDGTRYLYASATAVFPAGVWELVAGFNAAQQAQYLVAVPTHADSSATGTNDDAFVVSVQTTDPAVWFVGATSVGHSVDNIAPGMPEAVSAAYLASGVALNWDDAPETDFQYYRIYRETNPGFVPSLANLVQEVAASAWTDPTVEPWDFYYKITVLDHAGNESEAGSPSSVSGVQEGTLPSRTALLAAYPNPFNPQTTVSFVLSRRSAVKLQVFDVAGRLVRVLLNDVIVDAGRRDVVWQGRDESGRTVASGTYFYRLQSGDHVETKRMTLVK